jgi:anti-sigma regulatory factor (Ser/Thr protein kinase)
MIDIASHGSSRTTPPVQVWCREFAALPEEVGQARRFLSKALDGCPVIDETVLCLSELASNAVLHSESRRPGGTFTVRAEVARGDYVRVEVADQGGPWRERTYDEERPHGLAIMRSLAADSGIDGDAQTGWIVWVRIDWTSQEAG